MTENALTGLNPSSHLSQSILNQSLSPSSGTGAFTKTMGFNGVINQGIPIWDAEEIEVFSLMLYR